jgi:hypothetical protein
MEFIRLRREGKLYEHRSCFSTFYILSSAFCFYEILAGETEISMKGEEIVMNDMELKKGIRRSSMLQLFGILIIVNILIIDSWWLWNQKSWSSTAVMFLIFLTAFTFLAGLVLIFNQRAIELSYGKYGSLKVAAEQAEVDAKEIAEIRKRVETQSATVDLVAEQATQAKELSEEVARKNVKAEERLTEINNTLNEAKESLRSLILIQSTMHWL